jgi:hypothetical protein
LKWVNLYRYDGVENNKDILEDAAHIVAGAIQVECS